VVVLKASGVKPDGKRLILGVSVSLGKHELHWRDFLESLVAWGLNGVELIISDVLVGLQTAHFGSAAGFTCSRTPASMCPVWA
jgi:transposase-like protein